MNRNEMINEILNLYDKVDDLTQRLSCRAVVLDADNGIPTTITPLEDTLDPMTQKLVEFGKKELAKKVTDSWGNEVQYDVNDDGVVSYTKYEVWLKRKFRDHDIPDNMSKNDVLESCNEELHKIYEQERSEAERKYKESLEEDN